MTDSKMVNIFVGQNICPKVVEGLGLDYVQDGVYYKHKKTDVGFNECFVYLSNNLLSIKASKKNSNYTRQIVKMIEIKNDTDILDIINRLPLLKLLFP